MESWKQKAETTGGEATETSRRGFMWTEESPDPLSTVHLLHVSDSVLSTSYHLLWPLYSSWHNSRPPRPRWSHSLQTAHVWMSACDRHFVFEVVTHRGSATFHCCQTKSRTCSAWCRNSRTLPQKVLSAAFQCGGVMTQAWTESVWLQLINPFLPRGLELHVQKTEPRDERRSTQSLRC